MRTNVRPGTAIFTSDGEAIGTVKDVQGDIFKVDAPLMPDYWLACDCIASSTPAGLFLTVIEDRLGPYVRHPAR